MSRGLNHYLVVRLGLVPSVQFADDIAQVMLRLDRFSADIKYFTFGECHAFRINRFKHIPEPLGHQPVRVELLQITWRRVYAQTKNTMMANLLARS
jgi:hypothetical protein